jgi:hypothetical protein
MMDAIIENLITGKSVITGKNLRGFILSFLASTLLL